ncbi:integrase, catalytic region, zinc finger, CCHC-type containing protein [Tanacetum coccineum]
MSLVATLVEDAYWVVMLYVEVMSTSAYVDSETITLADGAQSSRVPVPLPDDPYVAAEESQPLGSRVPLTDKEFEASKLSGTRIDSSHSPALSDSTTPLSPDHLLTQVSPTPTPTRDSTFRKRYRSSYKTPSPSPSLTLPVQKRYRDLLLSETKLSQQLHELPKELIFIILSRLDRNALARVECVCKDWRIIINDPYMQKMRVVDKEPIPIKLEQFQPVCHSHVRFEVSLFLIFKCLTAENNRVFQFPLSLPVSFNGDIIPIGVSCCKRLMLLSVSQMVESDNPIKLLVVNPETRTCHHVPENKLAFPSMCEGIGICFNQSSKIFVIVGVFTRTLLDNNLLDYNEQYSVI